LRESWIRVSHIELYPVLGTSLKAGPDRLIAKGLAEDPGVFNPLDEADFASIGPIGHSGSEPPEPSGPPRCRRPNAFLSRSDAPSAPCRSPRLDRCRSATPGPRTRDT